MSPAVRRMSRPVAALAASALFLALATASWGAASYPPGPGQCCPDTLTIINVQNPAAFPHPATGDLVLGVGGIITGFAGQDAPFGFYMEMSNGLPYSGIGVYTGTTNHGPGTATNLQLGDSVVVYAKVKSFQGAIALGSTNGGNTISLSPLANEDVLIRVVSHGNPLPPFHVDSPTVLEQHASNPLGRPWDAMLVRVDRPVVVVDQILISIVDGTVVDSNQFEGTQKNYKPGFLVQDVNCSGECDQILVDSGTLTDVDPPAVGTILTKLQGVFDERESHRRIFLRNANDLASGTAPVAQDAFPIYDNDVAGSGRIDSVMVVFDIPVEKTSAELTGHYALTSGVVDGARRLDAPDDNRVVLKVHGAGDDGVVQHLTVQDVKSLVDDTPMSGPQTFTFYNGVLEMEKVRAPDAAELAGNPCEDRSRYSGTGSAAGLRAAFAGTVTGRYGSLYSLQGTTTTRGGLWVQSPLALTTGHAYLFAGALQEVSGETQGTGIVYVRDLGVAPIPGANLQSVHVLLDQTCDDNQVLLTGLDFDGMRVTVDRVVVTQLAAGGGFYVATPGTNASLGNRTARATAVADAPEQILVVGGNYSLSAQVGHIMTVTGVLALAGGNFVIVPQNNADLQDFGDLPTFSLPFDVSKSATASKDPDIVLGLNGELFMAWDRVFHEDVHSLSLDNTLNWSAALPIMHQGVQPAVTVTPSNKFGVLSVALDQLYFKQSTDGGHQMDPLVTLVDANATAYPALTVGAGEHFHAAWQRTGTGGGDAAAGTAATGSGIFYSRSFDGGTTFSEPIKLVGDSVPGESHTMCRIAASDGDSVYVFWQMEGFGNDVSVHRVLFSRSFDGGASFSAPRRVRDEANPLTSTVKLAYLGDAQVGPDGTVYVMGLQEGGPTDSVAFLKSTNGGGKFTLVGHLTAPAPYGLCPKSFFVAPGGVIHGLVGTCGTALYYTRSDDGGKTWGPAVNVTGTTSPLVGEPRGAKIILGPNGKPVIVWYAPVGGSTEIYSARMLN